MIIETRYSVGDRVYYRNTFRNTFQIIPLVIEDIYVTVLSFKSGLQTKILYSVNNKKLLNCTIRECDLFSSPELLTESLRESYEIELTALLATVNPE